MQMLLLETISDQCLQVSVSHIWMWKCTNLLFRKSVLHCAWQHRTMSYFVIVTGVWHKQPCTTISLPSEKHSEGQLCLSGKTNIILQSIKSWWEGKVWSWSSGNTHIACYLLLHRHTNRSRAVYTRNKIISFLISYEAPWGDFCRDLALYK